MHLLFFQDRALQCCLGTNTHPFQTIHATFHATVHGAILEGEFDRPPWRPNKSPGLGIQVTLNLILIFLLTQVHLHFPVKTTSGFKPRGFYIVSTGVKQGF